MKILVLTTSYPRDAGDYRGRFVHDLACGMKQLGHEVEVIAPHPGADAPVSQTMDGIKVLRVAYLPRILRRAAGVFGRFGVADTLRAEPWRALELPVAASAFGLKALARGANADLVVSNWLLPCGVLGAILAGTEDIPHIAIEHGGGARMLAALRGGVPLLSFIAAGTTAMHFVSHDLLDKAVAQASPEFRQRLLSKALVFPMPPPGAIRPSVSRLFFPPLRLLFVGRFVPVKGVSKLLEALVFVERAHLTLVGTGPLLEDARRQADKLNLGNRVAFLGRLDFRDVAAQFDRHDALVVPSLSGENGGEGVPRVLLEGMAAGMVPVVSDSGGITEIIQDKANGLVFPAGDESALVRCLNELLEDPQLAARMARAATSTAAHYSMDALLQKWQDRIPGL